MELQEILFFNEITDINGKSGPFTPRILTLFKKMGDSMKENHALFTTAAV
ncbi:hypothetical protein [Paenibacillus uliginis]|nr:hypothetical protein [Paenibacillus uliginis]